MTQVVRRWARRSSDNRLSSSCVGSATVPATTIRTGTSCSRWIAEDSALQVFWFQEQLHRMARGLEPDLALGRWGAVWRGLRANVLPVGRRGRAAVAEAVPA